MTDALNRPALARTTIIGATLEIELSAGLPAAEISITLYHEILEGAAVAVARPGHRQPCANSTRPDLNWRRDGCTPTLARQLLRPSTECWSFSDFEVILPPR